MHEVVLALLFQALGGIWCASEAGSVQVRSPQDFNVALQAAVSAKGCDVHYEVSSHLFGTAMAYDTRTSDQLEHLGGGGDKPLAWLGGTDALDRFLNDAGKGCCAAEISSLQACFCRIAVGVGLVDIEMNVSYLSPAPPFQYLYAVMGANVTNRTSPLGSVAVVVPTWSNLLDVMGETFAYTLDEEGDPVQPCSPTEEVRQALTTMSYVELFSQHREAFEVYGATAEDCKVADRQLFRQNASELCSSIVLTRLYLCSFLDASPLFEGTGFTSGGLPEFITVPNPSVAAVTQWGGSAALDVLEFPLVGAPSCLPVKLVSIRSHASASYRVVPSAWVPFFFVAVLLKASYD